MVNQMILYTEMEIQLQRILMNKFGQTTMNYDKVQRTLTFMVYKDL